MNTALKPIASAILIATASLTGTAFAQAPKAAATPAVPAVQPAASRAPIAIKAPDDWIVYDDLTYTPVLDSVSRHLQAARNAFDAKDRMTASTELRIVADELRLQATRVGKEKAALAAADKALVAADAKSAQETVKRMNATAHKVDSVAAAIARGTIRTRAGLDRTIDKAARADIERRWLVTDVATWYPVSEEPQRHFTDAVAAHARNDYRAAATDIRKAAGYLRLETARATGVAGEELNRSITGLDRLADAVEKGTVKDGQAMAREFAKASDALALEHRSKAAEAWTRKQYDEAGYELKAAAHGLDSAATWAGGEAKAGVAGTVSETRALGDKLASGAAWTRDEVSRGFESLGNGINALGQKLGVTMKASPFFARARESIVTETVTATAYVDGDIGKGGKDPDVRWIAKPTA